MKKKKTSGKHLAPRRTVQMPEDWLLVAQMLAAARPAPVMWLLVELLKKEAEAKGVKDLPPVPWPVPGSTT